MISAIVTDKVVKRYRRRLALDGFSLRVPVRSVTGIVGRNGAGKTTWMMTVAGYVRPTSGTVDLLGLGPFDAARHSGRLGILPQDSELPLDARVRALLTGYGRLQGLSRESAAAEAEKLLTAFNLADHADDRIKALSHGMRKRVMVAQAFIGSPDIVLLDEPLSGLDPEEAERMREFLLARRGSETMVISSHQLDDIERLCTHVAMVAAGRVERMSALRELTAETGRIVVRLRRRPDDLPALAALVPDGRAEWREAESELCVDFDLATPPEAANARLLPALLGFGVVSVTAGQSLKDAYLARDSQRARG